MHGFGLVKMSATSFGWVQKDAFLKNKVKEYEQRLVGFHEKLEKYPADKVALFNILSSLITEQCNRNSDPIDVSNLSDYQCRVILQQLHSTVSPMLKILLDTAPFKTVTNPFYNVRAKGKIAVLYNYVREQDNYRRGMKAQAKAVSARKKKPAEPVNMEYYSSAAKNSFAISALPGAPVSPAPCQTRVTSELDHRSRNYLTEAGNKKVHSESALSARNTSPPVKNTPVGASNSSYHNDVPLGVVTMVSEWRSQSMGGCWDQNGEHNRRDRHSAAQEDSDSNYQKSTVQLQSSNELPRSPVVVSNRSSLDEIPLGLATMVGHWRS